MSFFSTLFPTYTIHNEDMRFAIQTARALASRSRATRARVGCIIWDKKLRTIVSLGYNGTLPGEDNTMEKDGKTLASVVHAEVNALKKLSFWAPASRYCLIVTHAPCLNCAAEIVASGIREVYYCEFYGSAAGLTYLQDHGVAVKRVLSVS